MSRRMHGRAPARPAPAGAAGRLVLGAAHRGEERAAQRRTARATGHPESEPARELDAGTAAPPEVAAAVAGPGRPLGPADRRAQAPHAGENLAPVRLHEDAVARRSARAVGARAYAVGRDVVLGSGLQPGSAARDAVLAHELAHVAQTERGADPARVRRFNLFEAIADLFVGEFSEADLLAYLRGLEENGRIEDDMDSDNKARAVVAQGLHRERGYDVQRLLCEEMLSGIFDTPDQKGVLQVFDDAEPATRGRLLDDLGTQRLFDRMDDEQQERLLAMVRPFLQADRPPVAMDWRLDPVIEETPGERVPDEYRERMRGLFVDTLDIERGGERDTLAARRGFPQQTASGGDRPRALRRGYPHPVDTDGTAHAQVEGGFADEEGNVRPFGTTAAREVRADYGPVRYGHESALVRLRVVLGFAEADFSTSTTIGTAETELESRTTAETTEAEETTETGSARREAQEAEETRGREVEGGLRGELEGERTEGRTETDTSEWELAGRIEVNGSIDAELRAELAATLGLQVPELGDLIPVDDLLEAVGGPELLQRILQAGGRVGRAFAGVLRTVDVVSQLVDELDLGLTVEPSGGFSLGGAISGELRHRWSETITTSEELRTRLMLGASLRAQRSLQERLSRTEARVQRQSERIRELERTTIARTEGTERTERESETVERQPLRPVLRDASMEVRLEPASVGRSSDEGERREEGDSR